MPKPCNGGSEAEKPHTELASLEADTVEHNVVNTKTAPVDTIQLGTHNHTVLSALNSIHNVL